MMLMTWWQDTFFKTDPGIKPFYEDASVVLFNCDCRKLMPSMRSYDALATDFPFGIAWQSGHRIVQMDMIAGDQCADYDLLREMIKMADNFAFTYCRWDNLMEFPADMKPHSFVTWVKNNWSGGDLEHDYARQTESFAFWPKDGHRWAKGRPSDVLHADRVPPTLHPTEKPIKTFSVPLESSVCRTVFDPYAGSGSSLVAAKMLGKKALGVEIVQSHCEYAASRLAQGFLL